GDPGPGPPLPRRAAVAAADRGAPGAGAADGVLACATAVCYPAPDAPCRVGRRPAGPEGAPTRCAAMTTPGQTAQVMGVTLHLRFPDATERGWIGQDGILRQLLACWLVVDPADRPLSPRLTGPPGIGKTTLAMAAARLRKQPLYITQCTADTRPEDLL